MARLLDNQKWRRFRHSSSGSTELIHRRTFTDILIGAALPWEIRAGRRVTSPPESRLPRRLVLTAAKPAVQRWL
ncbi:hypothetical protein FA13DRAFT_1729954 [Coprinellus micaceus]|uniref:Uncharacterized protein n=1 Tax=Coprinellus micaceus TaxID=71717 RepID=A0A4Y7TI59_COPMI|nr:hypothetical protein FA13DRAFT_1729954 [Coprinellus micaceus]